VLNRLQIDGFAFDVELLVGARNAGLKIGEVPVVWVNSPTSKVQLARGLAAFVDLVRIYRRAKRAAAPASDHAEARP